MNPEAPLTPREELEVRVTALLMGELPPEEAQLLEAQIAADADLQKLHERLRHAVELLREASAMPEQPAPEMPVTLSENRRQLLLAHFQVVQPMPSVARVAKPRRDWSWLVPLGLAASLIALLGGAVWLDVFPGRRLSSTVEPDFEAEGLEYAASEEARAKSVDWSGQVVPNPTGRERDAKAAADKSAGSESHWFFHVPKSNTRQIADSSVSLVIPQLDGEQRGEAKPTDALGRTLAENAPAEGKRWGSQRGAIRSFAREAEAAPTAPAAQPLALYTGINPAPPPPAPAPVAAGIPLPAQLDVLAAAAAPASPEPAQQMAKLEDLPQLKERYIVSEPNSTAGKVNTATPLTPLFEAGRTTLQRGGGAGGRVGMPGGPQPVAGDKPALGTLFAKGKAASAQDKSGLASAVPPNPKVDDSKMLSFAAQPASDPARPAVSAPADAVELQVAEMKSDLAKSPTELAESKQVNETLVQRAKDSEALVSTKKAVSEDKYKTVKGGPAGPPVAAPPKSHRTPITTAGEVTAAAAQSDFGLVPDSGARAKVAAGGLGGMSAGTVPLNRGDGVESDARNQAGFMDLNAPKLADLDAIKDNGAVAAKGMFGFGDTGSADNGALLGDKVVNESGAGLPAGGSGAPADSKKRRAYTEALQHADKDNVAQVLRGMMGDQKGNREEDIALQKEKKDVAEKLGKSRMAGAATGSVRAMPVAPKTDEALGLPEGLAPKDVEFEGFITYGSPVQSTTKNALGQTVTTLPSNSYQPTVRARLTPEKPAMFGEALDDDRKEANAQAQVQKEAPLPFEKRVMLGDTLDEADVKMQVPTPSEAMSRAYYRGRGISETGTSYFAQPTPGEKPAAAGMVAGRVAQAAGATSKDGAVNQGLAAGRYDAYDRAEQQNQPAQENEERTRMLSTTDKAGGASALRFGNVPAPAAKPAEVAGQKRPTLKQEAKLAEQEAPVQQATSVEGRKSLKAGQKPPGANVAKKDAKAVTNQVAKSEPASPKIDPQAQPAAIGMPGIIDGFAVDGASALNPTPPASEPKWLYILRDGTIGQKNFATETNPIVGRTAFWSDDDLGKVNIDTASEGTYWDTPTAKAKLDDALRSNADPAQTAQALVKMLPSLPPESQAETVQQIAKLLPEQEYAKVIPPELRAKVKEMRDEDEARAPRPAPPADEPQPEIATSANAFSTFSLNVSDVSFKLAGGSLEQGKMPEPSTVRSEEFINALDYRDPEPAPGAPLAFASERARYPFAQNRDLLRFAVKTAAAGRQPGRPLNVVLLLDNSGSMERADRVNIVREALRVLAAQLQPQDMLSVVTFARTPRLWIDGVSGDKAGEATERVTEITPQGGTNIEAALDLGYATALRHYQTGSINRVVMLTDGAANLGDVDPDALKEKVEAHRKQGIALDCFGVGWEGYDDTLLEALSRNGDGRYGFINTPEEAASGFAGQLAGALHVAAADVKVQIEFNPRRVTSYRQIGYAKHQLTKEQFRDNTVDAAEIGAAESGNALYVVEVNPRGEGDLATVRVRFKVPGTGDYQEHEWAVPFTPNAPSLEQASPALRLAGTASAFSEWLTGSPYAAEVTPDRLLGLINGVPAIYGVDPRPQRLEWMIRQAKNISGK